MEGDDFTTDRAAAVIDPRKPHKAPRVALSLNSNPVLKLEIYEDYTWIVLRV